MIVVWIAIAAAWSSLIVAFDLTGLFIPDLVLGLAAWTGLRGLRNGQDLDLVLAVGLVEGLFALEAWALPVLLGLTTLATVSAANRVFAPVSRAGRALLVVAALLLAAAFEILLRMSVPSLSLAPGLVSGLAARAAASAALAVVLDGLTPRR